MINDYFNFAFNNLKRRKLRAWLTVLGIIIGISAVVSLISIGQGFQKAIDDQFQSMGVDKIIITPGGTFYGLGESVTALTDKDLNAIRKVRGVNAITETIYKLGKVKYDNEVKYTWIMGMPQDEYKSIIESIQNMKVVEGRDLEKTDTYKAVIGIRIFEGNFFDKAVNIRDKLEIEGVDFKVIGRLATFGNPQDDTNILIPLETAREVFNEPTDIDMIFVQAEKNIDTSKVAESISKELRSLRNVEKGEEDFSIQTYEDLKKSFSTIFLIVQIVVISIAGISIVVGGIGIMNTMYTSVLERTREIGIMKAIGAKNGIVATIFMIESGLLGLVGGAIGVSIGIGISKLVELLAAQLGTNVLKASLSPWLIFGALMFSFVVGMTAGTLPAMQASKLKPAEALRYE
ncbi:ABC transporter permease [Candidatus Woesearchaeota archaeon]|nr:ABC transporter permease [Candidatus Woesearchaeota archaeon]